ncbi:hypothetical protein [Prochlorococcus sp. MIT 1307]|nr:hypothetical protein [Prochlorococcus sp. MIT 1307]
MLTTTDPYVDSLGNEPIEIFGFTTEEELDIALRPLMQELKENLQV